MTVVYLVVLALLVVILARRFAGKNDSARNDSALLEGDAKRFAKLLISEIKLYQLYKIERGLKNNNLYESLHDEIEAARKIYKKSVANAEFERFFNDALVDVLADGDKSKLGLVSW